MNRLLRATVQTLLLALLALSPAVAADKPYLKRGDGTVADLAGQVLWQQDAPERKMNWEEAQEYCARLKVGQIKAWSLPTLGRLKKLQQDLRQAETGAAAALRDSNPLPYWSLTEDAKFNNNAWTIDFASGNVKLKDKKTRQLVRCLR